MTEMPMRELMARSAHARARRDFVRLPPWEQLPPVGREQGMAMADAMLDALMKPTVEMERAGQSTGELDDGDVCKVFCKMIVAAREGK